MKTCPCGQVLESRRQRYCSMPCRDTYSRANKKFCISLTREIYDQIHAAAKSRGISMNALVERALDDAGVP